MVFHAAGTVFHAGILDLSNFKEVLFYVFNCLLISFIVSHSAVGGRMLWVL